jgi:hypothetical protein
LEINNYLFFFVAKSLSVYHGLKSGTCNFLFQRVDIYFHALAGLLFLIRTCEKERKVALCSTKKKIISFGEASQLDLREVFGLSFGFFFLPKLLSV